MLTMRCLYECFFDIVTVGSNYRGNIFQNRFKRYWQFVYSNHESLMQNAKTPISFEFHSAFVFLLFLAPTCQPVIHFCILWGLFFDVISRLLH